MTDALHFITEDQWKQEAAIVTLLFMWFNLGMAIALDLYNSLTKRKEIFEPLRPGEVGLYSCGPTVYFVPHIGNYRSFLLSDILRRVLEFNGYRVTQVMNITDIGHLTGDRDLGEDKLLQQAVKAGISTAEIAKEATAEFLNDLSLLNILTPHQMPVASEHIDSQLELIHKLEKGGHTYLTSDGVYFDTSSIPDYGKLSTVDLKGLQVGASVEPHPEKRNPADFALWKFARGSAGQVWDTPWGRGFPGWHIECSAMSRECLGQPFDIHTGGVDHINIHHTNEIAQSEAAYGVPLARYWLHGEFLLLGKEKMSKSKGALFTIKDLVAKGFMPLAFRYLVLTAHYRTQLGFTQQSLKAAQRSLFNLYEEFSTYQELGAVDNSYGERFLAAINADLNMPQALAVVWDLLRSDVSEGNKKATLLEMDKVLGLGLQEVVCEVTSEIEELLAQRELARQQGDFAQSDLYRAELLKRGIIIEDTAHGPKWKKKYN